MVTTVVPLGGSGIPDRARRAALGTVVALGTRPFLNGAVPIPVRRRVLDVLGRISSPIPKGVSVDNLHLGGVPVWRLRPASASPGRDLFVLHGGGYNYGGLGTHGGAYATLARELGVTAWMPDYRLIPEHQADVPLQDALAAWTALHEEQPDARVGLTGDSAGAGLALALACEARDRRLPEPAFLALHSPWVDASEAGLARRSPDRILHRGLMRRDRELWVGASDPDSPERSPINRDLTGLPTTLVQWGAREALYEDARDLVAALEQARVDVTGEAHPDLWHDAFLHVPALAESRAWLGRTAAWMQAQWSSGE